MITLLLLVLAVLIVGTFLGLFFGLLNGAALGFWHYRKTCLIIYGVFTLILLPFAFISGALEGIIFADFFILFIIGCFAQAAYLSKKKKAERIHH